MSNLHQLVSEAALFAAAQGQADGSERGTPPREVCADEAGTITIDRTASMLGVPHEDAITVLVVLRTFLHNQFIVPLKSGATAGATVFGSRAALTAEAATMLADALDDIDEVFMRLDVRVIEGQPELVPLGAELQRDRIVVELANAMTAHEAAWAALRPETVAAMPHRAATTEYGMTQLLLALDSSQPGGFATNSAATATESGRRAQRRFAGRAPAPPSGRASPVGAHKVDCIASLGAALAQGQAKPALNLRSRTGARRDPSTAQRQ